MTGTSDGNAVAEFRRQLEAEAQPGPNSPLMMTDGLVGPQGGPLLRRCASSAAE